MIKIVIKIAVLDAQDEVYSIVETPEQAREDMQYAISYLNDAGACGHPAASEWVGERLPIRAVLVTEEEEQAFRDEAVPVLEREP